MPAYTGVRRLLGAVLFLLAALAPASAPARAAPADTAETVRIGVLAFLGADAAIGEWSPVQRRLQAALPGRTVSLVQLDHHGLHDAAAAGEIDFLITNPGHYVELEAELGASRILTLDPGPPRAPERSIGSAVIVKAGSGLHTLADLRGQRVAVVSPEVFGGFQTAWRELAAQGIDPQRDFAELKVVGLPMTGVFEAVARGEADAGIVRACLLESRAEWRSTFAVLDPRSEPDFPCATSTRLYPDWPLATLRQTPPALAKEVALALLAMSAARDGMEWAVPADYQAVHEMFRELQIGPYAYLREPTLMVLAERYWPWIAAFALLLAAWILYTVRVEHLVHVRTAELRAALAAREALEARIRANQEQADHLARLSVLGELSGTLAHELNQPLATIANYAHSLIRRSDNGRLTDDAVREASGEIAGQAERAAGILGRIRGFAKKRAAVRERVAPGALAAEAVALFRGMLANAPEVSIEDALPADAIVEVDPLQIQQVLLNLLKNGYDAARGLPPGRQHLAVRIDEGKGESAGHAHIAVRDHGSGLDAAARERLFEPFFTTKPDGLGLGLSICRTIAEAHRGRLTVDGTGEGPGCEFILSLPLGPSASEPPESRTDHAADR
ncbi:PhnD/SsuA/transferrin family substrate-binding protein [Aromatoleum toluclasticum]|uniref:sensor histidine kinase n=1 Tax=Aromatoleum toluclasticum TaxID=92003 RepID=UPI001D186075|nr:PhnD/SsuA/transferrin family substrate-binding protein [Aromatoleum toluclasticum]MCC4114418.1 PhnD/SsuA/transferrin family substrate-binding protein [Aromatoleum toluclasticum]